MWLEVNYTSTDCLDFKIFILVCCGKIGMLDFTKGGVFRNITRKQFVTYTQNNIFSVARFTFEDPICVLYYGIYQNENTLFIPQ